jgi:N-acetylmuramoyl-L-alanine amidase
MARTKRLKARLLREAVEENVATINGALPKPLRPGRRFLGRWGRLATTGLFLIAFVIALRVVPGSGTTAAARPIVVSRDTVATIEPTSSALDAPPQRLSVSALALGIRRIVIDAGHGGTSLGTSAHTGLHEKDVTLDIADRLGRRLESQGIAVQMTRQHDDTLSLLERSNIANDARGDLFLSIHVNSLPPSNRGIETYFLGPSQAPSEDAVATEENRDSGYSMADLRTLVDMIYSGARKDESRRLAMAVQQALLRDLRRVNPSIEDRGVKTAPFVVLAATRMPAILAEVSCLSNLEEAELLNKSAYRQSIADALFDGIDAYVHQGPTHVHKETVSNGR